MAGELGYGLDPAGEPAADDALVDEAVAFTKPPAGVELRHARRGAGAAGASVDSLGAVEDSVPPVGAVTGSSGPHHVADPADALVDGMVHFEALVEAAADYGAPPQDLVGRDRLEAAESWLGINNRVEVAAV